MTGRSSVLRRQVALALAVALVGISAVACGPPAFLLARNISLALTTTRSGAIIDASGTIGASGGEVVVTDGPLKGARVHVPEGAIEDGSVKVTVGHRESLPAATEAPAREAARTLVIEADRQVAFDLPATVTIPYDLAVVPEGEFPTVLYHDAVSGYRAIPLAGIDRQSHTVSFTTSHFSSFSLVKAAFGRPDHEVPADSGFRPDVDGFFIKNYSGIAQPGGYCQAFSVLSAWYYFNEKSVGKPALFRRFRQPTDDDPFRDDDTVARELTGRSYFIVSNSQEISLGDIADIFLPGEARRIHSALALTKKPQLLAFRTCKAGHSVLVYKYDPGLKRFWIYDNNDPGMERTWVEWNTLTDGLHNLNGPKGLHPYECDSNFRAEGLDAFKALPVIPALFKAAESEFADAIFPIVKVASPELDGNTLYLDGPKDVVFRGNATNLQPGQNSWKAVFNARDPLDKDCKKEKGGYLAQTLGPGGSFELTLPKEALTDCDGYIRPNKILSLGVGRSSGKEVELRVLNAGFKEVIIKVAPTGVVGYYDPVNRWNIVTWNKMGSATRYRVSYGHTRGVDLGTQDAAVEVATEEFSHAGPADGSTYYYRVQADVGGRWSDLSEEVQVTVGAANGSIAGLVKDAESGDPISDAKVRVLRRETVIATGNTGSRGSYSISVPPGPGYRVEVTKSNYLTANYLDVAVNAAAESALDVVLQIGASRAGNGDLRGKMISALSEQGVGNLSLRIRTGINSRTGATAAQTTSGSDGAFSFTGLTAGNYTIEAAGNGYSAVFFNVVVLGGTVSTKNGFISPILPSGETRVVLTWLSTPRDVDSHLTGPAPDGGRFHTYFEAMDHSRNGISYARLDRDDVEGFGRETTTVYRQLSGTYRFTVHDFTNRDVPNSTALADTSGAIVTVLRGSRIERTFAVPSLGAGTAWTVFEMNGATITGINRTYYTYDYATIQGLFAGDTADLWFGSRPAPKPIRKR